MPRAPQDRRPRGRPTLPSDEAKRHSLGIRTTKKIKDALQRAAELSGRSVAQEIEFRIEQSFDVEKAYGGPETQKVLRTLAGVTRDDEWTRSWLDPCGWSDVPQRAVIAPNDFRAGRLTGGDGVRDALARLGVVVLVAGAA